MFKKTITFTGFDEVEHTQDFYFHLPTADVTAMLQPGSDFTKRLQAIQKSESVSEVVKFYKELITQACGVRSEDGKRFIQTQEAKSELLDTPALDELLLELMLDSNKPLEFLTSLLPKKLLDKLGDDAKQQLNQLVADSGLAPTIVEDTRPAWVKENRNPTQAEFAKMTPAEQQAAFASVLRITK